MKKILYLLLGLVSVPAVSLMSDPNPLADPGLGYVATASELDLGLSDQEIEEVVTEVMEGKLEVIDEDESQDEAVLSSGESNVVSEENVEESKTKEIRTFRRSLSTDEKKLFRGIIKRRKKKLEQKAKLPKLTKLTKEKAKELLDKAKAKKAKREEERAKKQASN